MNVFRRVLLKRALPSAILALLFSRKAVSQTHSATDAVTVPTPLMPPLNAANDGGNMQHQSQTGKALRDELARSDGSMLGYKNKGVHAVQQTFSDKLDRVFYVSDYGVNINNSPEVNAVRLQRMLDDLSGQSVITRIVFADAGKLFLQGPIVIPNNTDIEIKAGVIVSGVPGNVKPLFVSQYWSYVLSKRNTASGFAVNSADIGIVSDYIGLWGEGTIDYNYSLGGISDGLDKHCICIASAKRVRLGGGLLISGAPKYAYLLANIQFLDAQRLRFDNPSDGLHLQPPIDYAFVRNLYGKTGDDMFALTGGDYLDYDLGLRGAFNHIDVQGIYGEQSLCAVKVAGNKSTPIHHLSIDGVYGTFSSSVIRIWTDSQQLSDTRVETCTIDNVGGRPGAGFRAIEVKTVGTGSVLVDNLDIGTISGDFSGDPVPVISVTTGTAGNATAAVSNLSCRCPRRVAHFIEVGGDGAGADTSRIDRLNVEFQSVMFNSAVADACGVKLTRGQISHLVVRGDLTLAPGQCVVRQTGGKIATVVFDHVTQTNGYTFLASAKNVDSSLPAFQFTGGFYTSPDKLLSLVSGYSVNTSGPDVRAKAGEVFTTTQGMVKVEGHVMYDSSCIPVKPVAGVSWEVMGFGIRADVGNISAGCGGFCYNTNPSLAGGNGLAASNGSVWKSILPASEREAAPSIA